MSALIQTPVKTKAKPMLSPSEETMECDSEKVGERRSAKNNTPQHARYRFQYSRTAQVVIKNARGIHQIESKSREGDEGIIQVLLIWSRQKYSTVE